VHGQVAHPLQVGHHPQRRDQHPQVARHRLLGRHQLERAALDLVAERVEGLVAGDHALGRVGVGGQQRRGGTLHRLTDGLGHRHEVGHDAVELVVVRVTHAAHRSRAAARFLLTSVNAG
jgi:hypothetical protein